MVSNSGFRVRGTGATFADALGITLSEIAVQMGAKRAASDRSVRIRAEADSLPALTRQMVDQLLSIPDEIGAALTDVQIEALRPLEGGYRCWARAGLSSEIDPTSINLIQTVEPVVSTDEGSTSITVTLLGNGSL